MSGQAAAPAAGLPAGRRWASLRSRPLRRVASSPASHCRSWRSHARPLVPCPAAAGAAAAGAAAAGAAAPPPPRQQEQPGAAYSCDLIGGSLAAPYAAPTPLPPHPRSAALKDMLPYLLRLALGDPQLHWRLGVALALLLASKACGLLAPMYFKQAVDALSAGGAAAGAAVKAAVAALVVSGLCRAGSGLAKELQHPVFTPVSQAAGRRLSFYALAHVLGLDLQFHLNRRTGTLSRMLERGTRSVAMIFRAVVFTFVPTAVELCLVCAILARSFNPRVSLAVVATFVAYAGWTVALTRAATRVRRSVKELDNAITGKAVDALLNFETVRLFGNEALETRQYDTSLERYQAASVELEQVSAALNAGQALILAAGLTGVLVAAATVAAITPGDLVFIQGMLIQLWAPLQFLGWFYRELRQSQVDMEDLFKLLETQSTLPDGTKELPSPAAEAIPAAEGSSSGSSSDADENEAGQPQASASSRANGATSNGSNDAGARQSQQQRGSGKGANARGLRVELRGVRFGYGGGRQVLRGVDITAEPGESIAVVGPSGSGKSTILRLLVRLYDVEAGQVLLDGVDVRELRQEALREAVAVVPQDTALFNDTILHNVAYGRPGSSLEQVQAAARAAQLDVAIARMPSGWGTVVGERGLKLSGGEKQRVAIARAFLREPRLLVCDEATSSLDTATERSIMASLQALAAGRTSVFVAHRLSTIQGCDRIYVLAEGRVVEQGRHEELLAARGVYFDMWRAQEAEEVLEAHLLDHHAGSDSDAISAAVAEGRCN